MKKHFIYFFLLPFTMSCGDKLSTSSENKSQSNNDSKITLTGTWVAGSDKIVISEEDYSNKKIVLAPKQIPGIELKKLL